MQQLTSRQVMQDAPVIPVIVLNDVAHAVPMAQALLAGGIRMLEITLRTPQALACMEAIARAVPEAVVGAGTGAEFDTFRQLYQNLPALEPILDGRGHDIGFPAEPSARYATTIGLTVRARTAQRGYHGFEWLVAKAPAEWLQLYAVDLFKQMRTLGEMGAFAGFVMKDEKLKGFLTEYQSLLG